MKNRRMRQQAALERLREHIKKEHTSENVRSEDSDTKSHLSEVKTLEDRISGKEEKKPNQPMPLPTQPSNAKDK